MGRLTSLATVVLPTTFPKIRERVKGIEPSQPAWKAGALPLSYTRRRRPPARRSGSVASGRPGRTCRVQTTASRTSRRVQHRPTRGEGEWAKQDSNLRRLSHQIYSLTPLAAWVFARTRPPAGSPVLSATIRAKTRSPLPPIVPNRVSTEELGGRSKRPSESQLRGPAKPLSEATEAIGSELAEGVEPTTA